MQTHSQSEASPFTTRFATGWAGACSSVRWRSWPGFTTSPPLLYCRHHFSSHRPLQLFVYTPRRSSPRRRTAPASSAPRLASPSCRRASPRLAAAPRRALSPRRLARLAPSRLAPPPTHPAPASSPSPPTHPMAEPRHARHLRHSAHRYDQGDVKFSPFCPDSPKWDYGFGCVGEDSTWARIGCPVTTTMLKNEGVAAFYKKRSTGSLSSTPRFLNSHSPSSSSSVFASSTSSFSRSTSFFHCAPSPTCVNLSAPSVRFSLDRSVSPNRSIAVSSQWRPDRPTHTTTSAPPSNRALVAFFVFSHRGRRRH
ncbi:hypothetical protein Fmac_011831 [Flemingia macrophylla]|uniref:Uncharacterized protein n=1 Tax=Flemingia macrophylla TaxID=520843 RepID=A0ABD1MQN0_9FABA